MPDGLRRNHPMPAAVLAVACCVDLDEQLVDRTLSGDLAAFEELVDRHRDAVYRVAARVVGPSEAEDVSQDTFVRAFYRLGKWRREGSFRAWLLQIAHNVALNALARKRPEPVEAAVVAERTGDGVRTPVERLESKERRERLEQKVGLLGPTHRAVLVLRDVEGLSYDEIADVMETPLGSVKGRLHRARGELIELLRHNTYDWELPDDDT
jgi:RNA polymerase sigma-70 factor, ECF subfamily